MRALILVALCLGVLSIAGACWHMNSDFTGTQATPTSLAKGTTPIPAASGTPGAAGPAGGQWLVAFAANLDSPANCHAGDLTGCDIYLGGYDDSEGTVSDLIKVAGTEGVADYNPALSPDACWVTFDTVDGGGVVKGMVANVASGVVVPFPAGVSGVTWAPDGASVAYAAKGDVFVEPVTKDCAAGTIAFGTAKQITELAGSGTSASAPRFTPDGEFVATQVEGAQPGHSQVVLFGINGGLPVNLTPPDGSEHPAVRSDGDGVVFDGGDAILRVVEADANGTWGKPRTYVTTGAPDEYSRAEPRYATCDSVLPTLPGWLGTDTVEYTLACQAAGATTFSHLWATTVDITDAGHTIDLSRLFEDLAGVSKKDFYDASIIPLPQSGRAGVPIT